MAICDHCRRKSLYSPCKECNQVVKKFVSGRDEVKDTKQHIRMWLSKIHHLLRDVVIGEKNIFKQKSRTYSDINIDNLHHNSPMSLREPEVADLFYSENLKTGSTKSLYMSERSYYSHPGFPKLKKRTTFVDYLEQGKGPYIANRDRQFYSKSQQDLSYTAYDDSPSLVKSPEENFRERKSMTDLALKKLDVPVVSETSSGALRLKDPRIPPRKRRLEDGIILPEKYHSDEMLVPQAKHKPAERHMPHEKNVKGKSITPIKKYNSDEILLGSISRITEDHLKQEFGYFFPHEIDDDIKVPKKRISSSELIKDTREMLEIRAEEERIRQEKERNKKKEEQEKKRIAREEKKQQAEKERLLREEAKRLEEEAKRRAEEEEKRIAEEKRRAEENRLAEEKRKRDEEEKRLAEEEKKRLLEKEKKQTKPESVKKVKEPSLEKKKSSSERPKIKDPSAEKPKKEPSPDKPKVKEPPPEKPKIKDPSPEKPKKQAEPIAKEKEPKKEKVEPIPKEKEIKQEKVEPKPKEPKKEEKEPTTKEEKEPVKQPVKTKEEPADDFKKLLEEQAKQKEERLRLKKLKEEEDRKAREAAEKKLKEMDQQRKSADIKATGKSEEEKPKPEKKQEKPTIKELNVKQIKLKQTSGDDLILRLVKLKQATQGEKIKASARLDVKRLFFKHNRHKNVKDVDCLVCTDSDIELDLESIANKREDIKMADIIIGPKVFKYKPPILPLADKHEEEQIAPILFKSNYKEDIVSAPEKKEVPIILPEENEKSPPPLLGPTKGAASAKGKQPVCIGVCVCVLACSY